MMNSLLSSEEGEISAEDFMKLSRADLDQIPFDLIKWQCKVKFCKCFTRIRDYSLIPFFYYTSGKKWVNIYYEYVMCAKHWKRYKGRHFSDIPLKKDSNGFIACGIMETKKEKIII